MSAGDNAGSGGHGGSLCIRGGLTVPSAGDPMGAWGRSGSPIMRCSFSEDSGKAERWHVVQDPVVGDTLQTHGREFRTA